MKIFQWATQSYLEDLSAFNAVVGELKDLAVRDLRLEGYGEDQIHFRLELDMRYGMQYNLTKITSPHLIVQEPEDFKDICDRFTEQYSAIYSPEATFPMGGINLECFYLTAYVEKAPPQPASREIGGERPPEEAKRSSRQAYWALTKGFVETPVYAFDSLLPGNMIEGPALIEAIDTTYVVEPGWRLTLDEFGNVILEKN